MKHQRIFLTAEWRNLAMLNYAVDPAVLEMHVPRGTELDFFQGQTFVSIVGFLFERTKLFGVPIPGHRTFEEVNLRFYIRRQCSDGVRRGVVFIKEIVPRQAVSTVARLFYNEQYVCLPMRHRIDRNGAASDGHVEYAWRTGRRWNRVALTTCGEPQPLSEGSHEQYIAEHYWGYSIQRDGGTKEYEVQHPPWRIWQTRDAVFDCDAAVLYGPQFAETLKKPPDSAFLAEGSAVTVRRGVRIE